MLVSSAAEKITGEKEKGSKVNEEGSQNPILRIYHFFLKYFFIAFLIKFGLFSTKTKRISGFWWITASFYAFLPVDFSSAKAVGISPTSNIL